MGLLQEGQRKLEGERTVAGRLELKDKHSGRKGKEHD